MISLRLFLRDPEERCSGPFIRSLQQSFWRSSGAPYRPRGDVWVVSPGTFSLPLGVFVVSHLFHRTFIHLWKVPVRRKSRAADVAEKNLPHRRYCCIFECHQREGADENVKFYRFPSKPYERDRRRRWIHAVRRVNPDEEAWKPMQNTRICSLHFVGNQKSNIEKHPAYTPTLFPKEYHRQEPKAPHDFIARFERWRGRVSSVPPTQHPEPVPDTDLESCLSSDTCMDGDSQGIRDMQLSYEKQTQTTDEADVSWRLSLFLSVTEEDCASTMVLHTAVRFMRSSGATGNVTFCGPRFPYVHLCWLRQCLCGTKSTA